MARQGAHQLVWRHDAGSVGVGMHASAPSRNQQGVALAIVVWFIAGMSLLVAGIVSHARVDAQMAQLHVATAKAVAVGDGAIQLMMAEYFLSRDSVAEAPSMRARVYNLGGVEVSASLYSAAALVNLNTAPQNVLAALFLIVGKVGEGEANFLADNVVKWRGGKSGKQKNHAGPGRFHAIEDLLRVEGASRTLLDAVRDFIVAGKSGRGGIDWAAAPETLLRILETTDPGAMAAISRRRENLAGSFAAAGESVGQAGGGRVMSGIYRADALVSYGDKIWLRRRWVSIESAPGSTLPWRMVRTEAPRVYAESNGTD